MSRASAHRGSTHHPPRFAGPSWVRFGGGRGSPLAPACWGWEQSTHREICNLPGVACAAGACLWALGIFCAMGGRARGILGADTNAGAGGEAGDGLCWGAARDGALGGQSWGAELLSLSRGRQGGERRSAKFLPGPKALRQEGPSLQITTVI